MSEPKEIFIVDDDPVVRHILSTVIAGAGYKVLTAPSGTECLSTMSERVSTKKLPHAILLDYYLQDMSGMDVLSALRHTAETAHIPVIILSAKTREEMSETPGEFEPDYYLEKPFKAEVVLGLLETIGEGATT